MAYLRIVFCRDLIEVLADYLDDELGWWERWQCKVHLAICRSCRAYRATYLQTIALARGVMRSER